MSDEGTVLRRIAGIRIQNILGIEDLEITPGQHGIMVEGGNAVGKTSIVEALKAVAKGGHDATLIRKGAEEGRVVIVFDDEVELTKTVRPEGSKLVGRHPELGRVTGAQTYLNGLLDLLSVNPADLLVAPAKERVARFLEAMPIKVSEEALVDATAGVGGEVFSAGVKASAGCDHALEVIGAHRKVVYDARTDVNRQMKAAEAAAGEMTRSLPEHGMDADAIRDAIAVLDAREYELKRKLKADTDALAEQYHLAYKEAQQALLLKLDTLDAEIARLTQEKSEARAEAAKADNERRAAHNTVVNATEQEYEPAFDSIRTERATMQERQREAGRVEQLVAMRDKALADADAAREQSERLTEALGRLDALASNLVSKLPIPGVTVEDGEVHKDGVPFPRLNAATQVKLVFEIAKLRAGKVPLVCLDGLERFDPETMKLFLAELDASDLQAVMTRVTKGPLTVKAVKDKRGKA